MSSSEVEEIKQRLDIIDVINEYVQLKPGGVNWKGLCPFHNEKSPSFMVNRERQFWHCFGCDEGGDVFAFIQKIEQMDFPEALKLLAQKAGVVLKTFNPQTQSERARLYEANEHAAAFFHTMLGKPEGGVTLEYLKHIRKLYPDTIRTWRLGYAPNDWRSLLTHLGSLKFTEKELIAAGLALSSQGRTYDRFRNRAVFPIVSLHGQVIGFSARRMGENDNEPKYINSPQTLIYDKGNTLYGLFQARGPIRERGHAILVEGNMDVIASAQAGVTNVVAASGTGLTMGHLTLLARFTKELHFCFDADDAGLRAAERGITLALSQGFFIKVIPLIKEIGKDPADIVEREPLAWTALVGKAVPVMEYVLSRIAREENIQDVLGRKRAFTRLIGWLSKISEPVERDYYLKKAAVFLDLGEEIIRKSLGAGLSSREPQIHVVDSVSDRISKPHDVQIAERMFSLALQRKEFLDYLIAQMNVEYFPEELMTLYKIIVTHYTIHKSITDVQEVSAQLRKEHQNLEHAYLMLLARGEEEFSEFQNDELVFQELKRLCERLKIIRLEEQKKELALLIRAAEVAGDRARLDVLLQQFQTISAQLAQRNA